MKKSKATATETGVSAPVCVVPAHKQGQRTTYNGIGVRELARRCQCDPAHISNVLTGKRWASLYLLSRLAHELQVTMDALVKFCSERINERNKGLRSVQSVRSGGVK